MSHQNFARTLMNWYSQHKRDLPWRRTKDPYKIWLSEIILQQTRVQQGLPYYHKFIEAFPGVADLANASEQEVLRLWQGLGYYSRARNLHAAAKYVAFELDGRFPSSFQGLRKLKGVGDYTAAAVASFAYGESVAVVDGNVFRVLSRYFGVEEDTATPKGKRVFQQLANELLPEGNSDTYNQAIMEFGALHCKPASPDCMFCPLAQSCYARLHGKQQVLPVKSKKVKVKKRYLYYIICGFNNQYLFKQRGSGDVWQGLFDFPCLEYAHPDTTERVLKHGIEELLGTEGIMVTDISKEHKHLLTHQRLLVRFCTVHVNSAQELTKMAEYTDITPRNLTEIEDLPKPILIHKFLKDTIY